MLTKHQFERLPRSGCSSATPLSPPFLQRCGFPGTIPKAHAHGGNPSSGPTLVRKSNAQYYLLGSQFGKLSKEVKVKAVHAKEEP